MIRDGELVFCGVQREDTVQEVALRVSGNISVSLESESLAA